MEFEIGDDPQGVPDLPETNRSAGIDTRPAFLFRDAASDLLDDAGEHAADRKALHHAA